MMRAGPALDGVRHPAGVPPPGDRPVVELKAGPPVWRSQQRLEGAGQVHKHVAHQEKPAGGQTSTNPIKAATQSRGF